MFNLISLTGSFKNINLGFSYLEKPLEPEDKEIFRHGQTHKKLPYPFLGRYDLVKGDGKARMKMAWGQGNRILVQEGYKWSPGSQPGSGPEGSPLTLVLKGGGVGGASQETKEPGHPVARLSV